MLSALVHGGLRAGILVLVLALPTLLFLKPSSPGFWAGAAASAVAFVFIGCLILLLKLSHQSPPEKG